MTAYLPRPRRRRRYWRCGLPRFDRQVVPGWFQPPRRSWLARMRAWLNTPLVLP